MTAPVARRLPSHAFGRSGWHASSRSLAHAAGDAVGDGRLWLVRQEMAPQYLWGTGGPSRLSSPMDADVENSAFARACETLCHFAPG